MNEYEAKQEARRERLLERAEKAEARARAAGAGAQRIMEHIPPGQPILVGHHSEKRHRRDLARIDSGLRRASDESEKAQRLRERAHGVGSGGISSDDPEATEKLRERIAELEAKREHAKEANKVFRKGGVEALAAFDAALAQQFLRTRAIAPHHDKPAPAYHLTNLGGNIRRLKERLAALEREQQQRAEAEAAGGAPGPLQIGDVTIEERPDINRVALVFPDKPSAEVRRVVKGYGFRWSRTEGAWLRHLNAAGRAAAKVAAETIQRNGASG